MRNTQTVTLFSAVTPVAITSSTDATPIVVTATAHGLANDDRVLIIGHTTNIAANGIFRVANKTANTFELVDEFTRASVAGTGAGAGSSGILVPAPPVLYVEDFRNIILAVSTSGTATTTLKVAGSLGKPSGSSSGARQDFPNFAATVSPANPYTYIQAINLDTGAGVNGVTGLVASGADIVNTYEVNTSALKYLTAFPITWTQGVITIKALLTSEI